MASSSNRRYGSSGSSNPRKHVVIGAQETVRVRYENDLPHVEAERRSAHGGRVGSSEKKAAQDAASHDRARRRAEASARRKGSGAATSAAMGATTGAASSTRGKVQRDRKPTRRTPGTKSAAAEKSARTAGASSRAGSRRPPTSTQGRRLSATKRDERERRQSRIRARRMALVGGLVAVVALVMWGLVALSGSSTFAVTHISVAGVRHLDAAGVRALADVPRSATLLNLDRQAVARRILKSPWIADVDVKREFPHTVRLVVTERAPAAVVDAGGAQLWVVSKDGYWLGMRGAAESSTVVIRDVEDLAPKAGRKIHSKELLNAIRIVTRLSPKMLAITRILSAPSVEKTALITKSDVQIFIGEATDIPVKERIALKILETQKGKVVYINVRVVESPTWRGLTE